ncbi:DinB family protein [Nocardioides sp.]|uniref:DinB family protein n=1 Tax=Nocardioides sp. TaxID=35761 RepID=UPI002BED6F34|nr:DinB family protein [Nocardioides sp.]HXH81235.1 DinB family protein [Nocardioides sp.]
MAHPGYDGSWLPRDQDPRAKAGPVRGERDTLVGYLEVYRTTLELKCQELTPAQLGTRSVPPSNMSLLGMVRHMARVEQSWFRRVIEERMDIPRMFQDEALDAGFTWEGETDDALVEEAWALWREEVAYAREVLDRTDLDKIVDVHGEPTEVRDIIVHMVEEYARHCGHADLIRECIDGRAGQ